MVVLYILLGLLGLLLLLLAVPVYGRLTYDGDLRATVRVWGIPITLLPWERSTPPLPKKKMKKSSAPKKKQEKKPSKWQELTAMFREDGPAATLYYLRELAKLAVQAAGRLLNAVTVDHLRLQMVIADEDSSVTAVRYGQVCSLVYPSLAAVETRVRVRHRQVRLEPNFLLGKSRLTLDIRFHIRVWQALWAAFVLFIRFVMMKETDETVNYKEVTHNGQ